MKTKSYFYHIPLLLILSFLLFSCETEKAKTKEEAQKPNIIFIMSDDHAMNAISSYGHSANQTPNIDRIAKEGIRFNQSFCTNAICGPSRAVMLTGKYSHINGHINNSVRFDGEQQTFPKILQENDYETAMIGKWHLKSEPTGFDYWNILPGQGSYYNPDFIEMGEKKSHEGYVTNLISQFTIDWLEERDTTKPFCLLMHHKAPHRTWMPSLEHLNTFDSIDIPIPSTFFDDYKNRASAARDQKMSIWKDMYLGYDLKLTKGMDSSSIIDDLGTWSFDRMNADQKKAWDKARREKNNEYHRNPPHGEDLAKWKFRRYMEDYLGTIESVDESVGEVLDYIDAHGLAENTIIVYTSDQGFYLGEHGWFDKRFMYEESLKMPLMIRYPKEIAKGYVSEEMVMNLDFAPTFLDYAGLEIPEEMQGLSMRQMIREKGSPEWRKQIYYHYYEYPKGGHDVKRHYGIRTQRYKLIHYYYDIDEWELFDLKSDPHEMNNLYGNIEYTALIQDLKTQLKELQAQYKDDNANEFLPVEKEKKIHHLGIGKSISLLNAYSNKYNGGGSHALIDGELSINELTQIETKKLWQGYEGVDLVATIDLKKEESIHKVSAGFMQNTDAWVFSPEWLEISYSLDNRSFKSFDKIQNPISEKSTKEERLSYSIEFDAVKARYIKLHAKSIGTCPDWHKGAGSKAWLFVDEIIIR